MCSSAGLSEGAVQFKIYYKSQYIISLLYSTKFWRGEIWSFWHFPARPSKFNPSNCLKQYSIYRCMVKDSDHPSKYFPSNIWRVSIHQNFALYGSYVKTMVMWVTVSITNHSRLIMRLVIKFVSSDLSPVAFNETLIANVNSHWCMHHRISLTSQ